MVWKEYGSLFIFHWAMEKKVSRNEMGHLLPVKCSSMEFDRRTHALRRILESWICVHHFGSSVGIIGAVEWYSLLCFLWPQLLEYCLFYRVRNGVPTFVITRFFRWSDEDSSFYLVICSAEVLSSRRGFFSSYSTPLRLRCWNTGGVLFPFFRWFLRLLEEEKMVSVFRLFRGR